MERVNKGEIIHYKTSDNKNSTMFVDSISNDTLFVRKNMFSTIKKAETIDLVENYVTETEIITKLQLDSLHQNKKLAYILVLYPLF